jgi:ADP-ribosyl-[dinitrogen reductase] hydrolase
MDRLLGAIIGLAVGDAARASTVLLPDTASNLGDAAFGNRYPMGGPVRGLSLFDRRPGVWADGTSMALCLATSLVETGRFDPRDQMERYLRWWRQGYLTATGRCLSIGATTQRALERFEATGNPMAGVADPRSAGNGSLLRLAPVVAWAHREPDQALALARESSLTTHASPDCLDACECLAGLLILAWSGADLTKPLRTPNPRWTPAVQSVAAMDLSEGPEPGRPSSNYVVDTLARARWVLARAANFQEALRMATRLGDGTHAVAVVVGQLAGARWGMRSIPRKWVARLVMCDEIQEIARRIAADGPRRDHALGNFGASGQSVSG